MIDQLASLRRRVREWLWRNGVICLRRRMEIMLLVDGALDEVRAHGLRRHLAGCDPCRRELRELEALAALARR